MSTTDTTSTPTIDVEPPRRIAYSVEEAAQLLSVGRDSIYELINTGRLTTFKIGARRLIALSDIHEFVTTARETER